LVDALKMFGPAIHKVAPQVDLLLPEAYPRRGAVDGCRCDGPLSLTGNQVKFDAQSIARAFLEAAHTKTNKARVIPVSE
jgi:hypothetical protein